MVLCNIVVKLTDGTPGNVISYPININGRKRVKICNISYLESGAVNKLIQIRSSVLRMPHGNVSNTVGATPATGSNNFITFSSQPAHNVANICSDMNFICDFNGFIDIQLVDVYGSVNLAGSFQAMSITMDITDDDEIALPNLYSQHPELYKQKSKK